MKHHPVFEQFTPAECEGTGQHIFDFLGAATDVAYKKGWEKWALKKGASYNPQFPPVNEHYFDWIALLQSVSRASGTFRMAELGAGWAPWLVRSVFAAKHIPAISNIELVGVEADATHFGWTKGHFRDNGIRINDHHLIHGAIAPTSSVLKFPKIQNPDEDYGASLRSVNANTEYVKVRGFTLADIISRFSGPVDFLHVDIQGAEYEVLPPAMELLNSNVKSIMVGTHLSTERHDGLLKQFVNEGWEQSMVFPRNEEVETEYGSVKFGDGFLYLINPQTL